MTPHSPDYEAAVLGSAILHTDSLVKFMDGCKPDLHFHSLENMTVAKAIHELASSGAAVDLVSISNKLLAAKNKGGVNWRQYTADLTAAIATTSNTSYYIQELNNFAIRRQLIKASQQISAAAADLTIELPVVTQQASQAIATAIDSAGADSLPDTHKGMTATMDAILEQKYGNKTLGLATGFAPLDDILVGGLGAGQLVILAARPGMGKSAFAMDLAYKTAKAGGVVVVYSLEMSREQLDMRLLSAVTGIAHYKLLTGELTDEEIAQLNEAVEGMAGLKLLVFDKGDVSPAAFIAKCKRVKHEHGLALGVVDYLQIMNLETGNKQDSTTNKLEAATRQLKRGAVELGAPLLVLSQLSRGMDESARPTLQRLRGSGSIEQDADKVLFLYRPGYYNDAYEPGLTEVIVAKNRQGRSDTAELYMNLKTTSFSAA